MKGLRTTACAFAMLAGAIVSLPTHAIITNEVESNNTFATAQPLSPPVGPGQFIVNGSLSLGDPDYYSFDLGPNPGFITAKITSVSDLGVNDPQLSLLFPNGALAANDDDTNGDLLPLIFRFQTVGGGLFAALVDYSQFAIDSGDTAPFNYTLQIDVQPIPEPSTCALLLAGLAMLGFMNRRAARK